MSSLSDVVVHDLAQARTVARDVYLGQAFAFFNQPGTQRIESRLGNQVITLPGGEWQPLVLPRLQLRAVTSDKALYRAGKEVVHLLVVALPATPAAVVNITLERAGHATTLPVALEEAGLAVVPLRDLPCGDYEVRHRDDTDTSPCRFTVAEYRLAPLVVGFATRSFEQASNTLRATLRIETYGVPVEGNVRVELTDAGQRVAETTGLASGGLLAVAFPLDGDGPHALNVQLQSDPSRTATVPLVGSERAQRTATLFSALGPRIEASLLPGPTTRCVRGLFLDTGEEAPAPFVLPALDNDPATLHVTTTTGLVSLVAVSLLDPAKRWVLQREETRAGESLTIEVPDVVSLLWIGAFVNGQPWEGWAALLRPSSLHPEIVLPEQCEPGAPLTLEIRNARGLAYLLVKDARLLSADTPQNRLAECIKRSVSTVANDVPTGPVTTSLSRALPRPQCLELDTLFAKAGSTIALAEKRTYSIGRDPQSDIVLPGVIGSRRHCQIVVDDDGVTVEDLGSTCGTFLNGEQIQQRCALLCGDVIEIGPVKLHAIDWPARQWRGAAPGMLERSGGGAVYYSMPAAIPMMMTGALGSVVEDESEPEGSSPEEPTAIQAEPEVLFAGLCPLVDGRATVTVSLPTVFADYVVEAFVVDGLDWSAVETRFQAAKDPFVQLDLPAFVHPADQVEGRLQVGAASGRYTVTLKRAGTVIPLALEERPLEPGEILGFESTELWFRAEPGDYEATIHDLETGRSDRSVGRVEIPGKLRSLAHSLRLLQPGDAIARSDDPAIQGLRVLPGLVAPLHTLIDATADYGHACCEQTAAKLLAGCALYLLAGSERERRSQAESIIQAGIERERSMWLPRRGFKMYPESPNEPHDYYGRKAARYLWNLALLRNTGSVSPRLSAAISEGLKMAGDATTAYRLPWPPTALETAEDAYAAVRFGENPQVRAAALARARRVNAESAEPTDGAVQFRAELAYAAATLLRVGTAEDHSQAVRLSDRVLQDLGASGRLYSTIDSVAAIAVLTELLAARLLGQETLVEVDGLQLSLPAALSRSDVQSVRAVAGIVNVEVVRLIEEDWDAPGGTVVVEVALQGADRLMAGQALDLCVRLPQGYRTGDLLWVCLPASLSRLVGGGQVKKFSVDFLGASALTIPLVVTSATATPQHFAVCVRNMFEEERRGSPGPLTVTVQAPNQRWWQRMRSWLGQA